MRTNHLSEILFFQAQERRRQKIESTQKPQTPTSSGYSRRFENEWRAFEKKYRGKSSPSFPYHSVFCCVLHFYVFCSWSDMISGANVNFRKIWISCEATVLHEKWESSRYRGPHLWSNQSRQQREWWIWECKIQVAFLEQHVARLWWRVKLGLWGKLKMGNPLSSKDSKEYWYWFASRQISAWLVTCRFFVTRRTQVCVSFTNLFCLFEPGFLFLRLHLF